MVEIPASHLPVLDLPYVDGMIAAHFDSPMCADGTGVWLHFMPHPDISTVIALASLPGVATVLHPRYITNARSAVALTMATYLLREREAQGDQSAVVTCAVRPDCLPDGSRLSEHPVRIIREDTQDGEDAVVWEILGIERRE